MANERFFSVRHPSAHATDKRYAMLVASAVATSWPIPEAWRGQLVAIMAYGTDIFYSVTDAAQTVNPAAVSDPNATMLATVGLPLIAGGIMDRALNGSFLNWAPKSGGTGTIYAYLSQELVRVS